MSFVVSLVALLLVLAICAVGVRWLAQRAHGHQLSALDDELCELVDERCNECHGSGATRHLGDLKPCNSCEGTGIQTAPF